MMSTAASELSSRKRDILRAVVESYIERGEPVGSRALTEREGEGGGEFPFSSATIRGEMAELEALGYLTHPHTSAGRVPSERGYRLYVDDLMPRYEMSKQELRRLREGLAEQKSSRGTLLRRAGKVASEVTGYPAIALRRARREERVLRFTLAPVDERSFLLVLVLTPRSVRTRFVHRAAPLGEKSLAALEALLNRTLAGRDLSALPYPFLEEMERALLPYGTEPTSLWEEITAALAEGEEEGDLALSGVETLLRYREYADTERLSDLLRALERAQELLTLVSRAGEEAAVYIGQECALDGLRGSSLVLQPIEAGGARIGAIGVVGPCRMQYARVLSTVRALARIVEGEEDEA